MEEASAKSILKQVGNCPEKDQQSNPSNRHVAKSGTQNGQQPLNATGSQENMGIDEIDAPKILVKRSRSVRKRRTRDVVTDVLLNGVGNNDVVAFVDVAPAALQAATSKRAPTNRAPKQDTQEKLTRKRIANDENQSGNQRKRIKLDKKVPIKFDRVGAASNDDDSTNGELDLAVEKDDLEINIISPQERKTILEKVKDFIELKRVEMSIKAAPNEKTDKKWSIVHSALKRVSIILSRKNFLESPLPDYNEASDVFRDKLLRCGHQQDEERTLLDIFREFSKKMSSAFCCGRFFTATPVGVSCTGHKTNCNIEDGDLCYKKGREYYCFNWCAEREGITRGMKTIIYRHFRPENFEKCSQCPIVWHPKCRQLRLLKKRNNHPCQNTNDMIQFPNFSKSIPSTPLQRKLSEIYHQNRGNLPELNFIHSKCAKTITFNRYSKNILPNPEDYAYTSNQFFVTVLLENIDTMIFSFNTQEYRSGPRKGWVVIELLDSLSILKENRSKIYKRIIWSYLKYARESGFKIVHLYSCAAEKGKDYIFGGHPLNQVFLKKDELDKWYRGLFEGCGEEFGHMNIGYAEDFFNEAMSKSSVSEMCQSLVLGNGFWNDNIEVILKKMPENKSEHFDYFKNEIQNVNRVLKNSLFYVKLTNNDEQEKEIEDVKFPFSSVAGNCEQFLDMQYEKDIEFTDLRQAQYGTRQILLEIYLARAAQNPNRKPPTSSSVFSSKSIVPTWNH